LTEINKFPALSLHIVTVGFCVTVTLGNFPSSAVYAVAELAVSLKQSQMQYQRYELQFARQ